MLKLLTMAKAEGNQVVCVTGAGGFIRSWVVKELLLREYVVRGTARDPSDQKSSHLQKLDGAKERLSLYCANLEDYNSLCVAFNGCDGVFNVAAPVSKDPGARNGINAAADTGVRRVVFTSSYGAVHMDPNRSHDTALDESCWSDLEFCKTDDWYCYAKTVAEATAEKEASKRGIQLVVVVPSYTTGEILQPTLNISSRLVANYLNGTKKSYPNGVAGYADVRDTALAHVLASENPEAHGRYLCIGTVLHRCEDNKPMVKPYKFSNQRLRDLGLEFTPIKESLYRTVIGLQDKGHLPVILPRPSL